MVRVQPGLSRSILDVLIASHGSRRTRRRRLRPCQRMTVGVLRGGDASTPAGQPAPWATDGLSRKISSSSTAEPPSPEPWDCDDEETLSEAASDGYLSDCGSDISTCASAWSLDEGIDSVQGISARSRAYGPSLEGGLPSAATAGRPEEVALRSVCRRIASVFGDAAANPDEW
mmetsp:Transcript_66645/g.191568  ORF Transcript_66645/g.191568 Transcript_66645/m.191568 type:complete len:173 (-) Transcript_66645:93-611(-)